MKIKSNGLKSVRSGEKERMNLINLSVLNAKKQKLIVAQNLASVRFAEWLCAMSAKSRTIQNLEPILIRIVLGKWSKAFGFDTRLKIGVEF